MPYPGLARGLFVQGVPFSEKWQYRWGYGSMRKELGPNTPDIAGINAALDKMGCLFPMYEEPRDDPAEAAA